MSRRQTTQGLIMTVPLLSDSAEAEPVRRTSDGSTSSSLSSADSLRSSGSSESRSSTASFFGWGWICGASIHKTIHECCATGDLKGLTKVLEKQSSPKHANPANSPDAQDILPLDYVLSFARGCRTQESLAIRMAVLLVENGATIPSKLPEQARGLGLYLLADALKNAGLDPAIEPSAAVTLRR